MNRTMITATNTLSQLQKQMDLISNNIANIDTIGFKRREANFTELLYQEFRNNDPNQQRYEPNRLTPVNIRQGVGAKLAQTQMIMAQGSIKNTDRQLDAALTKEGQYFRVHVQDHNGAIVRLTRAGNFSLSPVSQNEVMLVNSDGYPVLDENNNSIIIQGNVKEYKISPNGRFTAVKTNGTEQSFNLGVYQVKKPQFLEQKGKNLLGWPESTGNLGVTEADIVTELNGPLRNQIEMKQGALEQSNVDFGTEMTELINVQRSYQFQARAITMSDQMMGLVNGIR